MAAMAASDSLVSHNVTTIMGPKCYLQVQILNSRECTFPAQIGTSMLFALFDHLKTCPLRHCASIRAIAPSEVFDRMSQGKMRLRVFL